MQHLVQIYKREIDTVYNIYVKYQILRNKVGDDFVEIVRKIQQLQFDHHDICDKYGTYSTEARESHRVHSELNRQYNDDWNARTEFLQERISYFNSTERSLRAIAREQLGDMVYMSSSISSEYELNQYFKENGIQRSVHADFNKNTYFNTYTLMHTKSIGEYNYFINTMLDYFQPNTEDGSYKFKVGYTQEMYLEFSDEWWSVLIDDIVVFSDPILLEALNFMDMSR